MSDVKVLILIDAWHSKQMLDALSRLLDLGMATLLLAYVEGPAHREGLELVSHRPGASRLPSDREMELQAAEDAAAGRAIAVAEEAARSYGSATETLRLFGKPGQAICELADQRRPDLVVVHAGGRDRPSLGPGSLGKAAKFIADHCRVPVLLLRTG